MYKRYWEVLLTYICFIFSALYVFAPILISGFGVPKEKIYLNYRVQELKNRAVIFGGFFLVLTGSVLDVYFFIIPKQILHNYKFPFFYSYIGFSKFKNIHE